jgi:HD-like signal output (HDOD) protein/signal transduction histidine kinase
MNGRIKALDNLKISGNLPSMPQVLVQLIDICHAQDIDLQEVVKVVTKDAPISAKVLQLVNSAFIGSRKNFTDVGQAIVFLGADVIKNLAISISVQQVFRRVDPNGLLSLDRFWHHSFQNALLAQNIAETISFPSASEAYLAGLLHDIGKLILWIAFPGQYAPLLLKGVRCHDARLAFLEQEKLGIDHSEAGGWLCQQWQLPSTLGDAVRYHHHPVAEVAQALPLVKIIALADLLSHGEPNDEDIIETAHRLLQISPVQLESITADVDDQIALIADEFNIRIPSPAKSSMERDKGSEEVHKQVSLGLINRVRDITQLTGALEELLKVESKEQMMLVVEQSLKILFNEDSCLFFIWSDRDYTQLQGQVSPKSSLSGAVDQFNFTVKSEGNSLLERAVLNKALIHSFSSSDQQPRKLSLLDQQLLHLFNKEAFSAVPMVYKNEVQGLLIIAFQQEEQKRFLSQLTPIHILAQHAAIALYLEQFHLQQADRLLQERIDATSQLARKVAHEINNPVAILKNYTHILKIKSQNGKDINSELATIDEELTRIGHLTEQLQDLATEQAARQSTVIDINKLMATIFELYTASTAEECSADILFTPDATNPTAIANADSIRQIIINLINNAIDAVSHKGRIEVKTGTMDDRVTIAITDNGTGIPKQHLKEIYSPGFTTKHNGHSGLGLAIIKKLTEEMGGSILCQSSNTGTTFSIFLPAEK